MKCMNINKRTFYYALFSRKIEIEDDYGNKTGEYIIERDDPLEFKANISPAKGENQTSLIGDSEDYDKVIVLDNFAPKIVEDSALWIDSVPEIDENGKLALDNLGNVITPYDYIVKKVAPSINGYSIAISKVKVKG